MNKKNRPMVTKQPVQVQGVKKVTNHFMGIPIIHLKSMIRKIERCQQETNRTYKHQGLDWLCPKPLPTFGPSWTSIESSSFKPPHYLPTCTGNLPNMKFCVCQTTNSQSKILVELTDNSIAWRADHINHFWHHLLSSPVVIVWIVVGQHLFLTIIPIIFMVRTGRLVWCDRDTHLQGTVTRN